VITSEASCVALCEIHTKQNIKTQLYSQMTRKPRCSVG